MSPEPHPHKTESTRDLKYILSEGITSSATLGFGDAYLAAFAVSLAIGDIASGFIVTLPPLVGSVIQLFLPHVLKTRKSQRRGALVCAALQVVSLIPLILGAWRGNMTIASLFAVISLYFASAMAFNSVWSSWMENLVPTVMRSRFFARRNFFNQGTQVMALALAGFLLEMFKKEHTPLKGFVVIFALAAAAKILSIILLGRHTDVLVPPHFSHHIPFKEFFRRFKSSQEGNLLFYMLAMGLSVVIAGPFFTPFLLSHLQFTYTQFMAVTVVSFLSRLATLAFLQSSRHNLSSRAILIYGGLGITMGPLYWIITDNYPLLLVLHLQIGSAWAAYELGTFLMYFDTLPHHERTSLLSIYNFVNAIVLVIGTGVGGFLLNHFGTTHKTYMALFTLSLIARWLTIPALLRVKAKVH